MEATVLGTFTDTGKFHVLYEGKTVAYLDMDSSTTGFPGWSFVPNGRGPSPGTRFPEPEDLTAVLKKILSRLNICSKESMIRQYDHEVQGGSVIKPLTGIPMTGRGCSRVETHPQLFRGDCGLQRNLPRYSDIDSYCMVACAVDEAVRNNVAVGADPDRIAALDNFCWPDPVQSERRRMASTSWLTWSGPTRPSMTPARLMGSP